MQPPKPPTRPSPRGWRSRKQFAVLCVLSACLAGCALIAPVPSPPPAMGMGCTTETLEARKKRPLEIPASGSAAALIIHAEPNGTSGGIVSSAHPVYLRPAEDPNAFIAVTSASSAHPDRVVVEQDDQRRPAALWTIMPSSLLHRFWWEHPAIRDGEAVRLRLADGGYLARAAGSNALIVADRFSRDASTFIIYKADVPDAEHPQTCDSAIRSGDYVFLRQRDPAAWLRPNAEEAVQAGSTMRNLSSRAVCVQEKEVCHRDNAGMYCAWDMDCPSAP